MQDLDLGDHDLDGSEMEGSLLKAVRTKCVIQLLLLGALDSLQVRTLLINFTLFPLIGINVVI